MDSEVIIIVGKRGFGKSNWLRQYCANRNRVFAFDPFAHFAAEYLTSEYLIDKYDNGEFNGSNSFRVASFHIDCVDLLGSLAYKSQNSLFVLEECAYVFQKGERLPGYLREIVFLGRKFGVSLIVTSQRPTFVPIDLRSQASRLISTAQHEKTDTEWMRAFFGNRFEELSELKELEYLDSDQKEITRYTLPYSPPQV